MAPQGKQMSYCRTDVYALASRGGFLAIDKNGNQHFFDTRAGLLAFLTECQAEGMFIPDHAFERLRREIAEESPKTP